MAVRAVHVVCVDSVLEGYRLPLAPGVGAPHHAIRVRSSRDRNAFRRLARFAAMAILSRRDVGRSGVRTGVRAGSRARDTIRFPARHDYGAQPGR